MSECVFKNNTADLKSLSFCCLIRYDMTPARKKTTKSNSDENYGIDDLHSDDSTDEEDQPRKVIPNWAVGRNTYQYCVLGVFYVSFICEAGT